MTKIKWNSCAECMPSYGIYLVTVDTDDGREIHTLLFDGDSFIHEGEPTYCAGYYFRPIFWAETPDPCDIPIGGDV